MDTTLWRTMQNATTGGKDKPKCDLCPELASAMWKGAARCNAHLTDEMLESSTSILAEFDYPSGSTHEGAGRLICDARGRYCIQLLRGGCWAPHPSQDAIETAVLVFKAAMRAGPYTPPAPVTP
jgi:hypothetical protein